MSAIFMVCCGNGGPTATEPPEDDTTFIAGAALARTVGFRASQVWVVCVRVGRHYNGPKRASPPPWSGSDSTPAPRPARAHHLQFGPQRQSIWVHTLEGPASPIFSGKQWFMVVLCKLASCITVSHRNSGSKTMQRDALTTDVLPHRTSGQKLRQS